MLYSAQFSKLHLRSQPFVKTWFCFFPVGLVLGDFRRTSSACSANWCSQSWESKVSWRGCFFRCDWSFSFELTTRRQWRATALCLFLFWVLFPHSLEQRHQLEAWGDLYEILHLRLDLVSLCLLTGGQFRKSATKTFVSHYSAVSS